MLTISIYNQRNEQLTKFNISNNNYLEQYLPYFEELAFDCGVVEIPLLFNEYEYRHFNIYLYSNKYFELVYRNISLFDGIFFSNMKEIDDYVEENPEQSFLYGNRGTCPCLFVSAYSNEINEVLAEYNDNLLPLLNNAINITGLYLLKKNASKI